MRLLFKMDFKAAEKNEEPRRLAKLFEGV
jgi:hypothetical protein